MINKAKVLFVCLIVCFMSILVYAQDPPVPTTVVKLISAKKTVWQKSIIESGSLSAFKGIMLASQVSGRVTKIHFRPGTYIQKGTLLIEVFPDIVKADLEKYKAVLAESKLQYQRDLKLFKKGFVNSADMDRLKSQLKGAQADVDSQQALVDEHFITAPFSGNLGLSNVSVGDYVVPGQQLVSLQSADMRVDFSVSQKYITKIKVGDTVTISSGAFSGSYAGKIYAIDSVVNSSTRTINVRARIQNPKHVLVPGTFVKVRVNIGKPESVVVIPATAVVYAPDSSYVYLFRNGKAAKNKVILGAMLPDNKIIVAKGLKEGDPVVGQGQLKLYDGSKAITLQEYQAKQKAAKK